MHADIDAYLKGRLTDEDRSPEFIRAIDWIHMFQARGFRCIGSEVFVYSKTHRIGGKLDAVFRHTESGKCVIVDWKYTRRVSSSLMRFQMQLSWYKWLLKESYGIDAANVYIVQIHEETGVSEKDIHVISQELLINSDHAGEPTRGCPF